MEDPVPGPLQRSLTAGPGDLRRSNQPLTRSPSYHQHQAKGRRGGGGGGGGGKPTLEIYRPPNVRVDVVNLLGETAQKLNVHAKEFTMHHGDLNLSRSSGNIAATMSNHVYNNNYVSTKTKTALQQSKSSGNVMHALHRNSLQQSTSSGNVLQPSPRVHFRFDVDGNPSAALGANQRRSHRSEEEYLHAKALRQSKTLSTIQPTIVDKPAGGSTGLKRSKSMAAADSIATAGVAREAPELGSFPPEVHSAIQRAVEDPNQVSARSLMQLVRHIMDRVVESRSFAEPAAKLCITIIEKEKNETFLESLLNTCQLWYQSRDKYLRSPRYPAFMAFLNEMYCQLKRRQLQLRTQYDGVSPGLLLLTLLAKCCQDCLKPPAINSLKEMECLFFVLSSIGRDLETEVPARMNAILGGVRDAFLTSTVVPAIRKTLLQLIELHAAQWQLPAPAIMYYYPATNK